MRGPTCLQIRQAVQRSRFGLRNDFRLLRAMPRQGRLRQNETCNAHRCLPPPAKCLTTKDCVGGTVCNKVGGICVECISAGDCSAAQTCSESVCIPAVCLAGSAVCATVGAISKCKADQTGYDNQACPSQTACDDGACKPLVCLAKSKICDGNNVLSCNDRGTAIVSKVQCAAGEGCAGGVCAPSACKVGEKQCKNKQVLTCNASQTGFDAVACPAKQACDGDHCAPEVCAATTNLCEGAKHVKCNATGTGTTLVEDCAAISGVSRLASRARARRWRVRPTARNAPTRLRWRPANPTAPATSTAAAKLRRAAPAACARPKSAYPMSILAKASRSRCATTAAPC